MNRRRTIIFAVLVFLLLCFIWGQSMLPRKVSAEESVRLMRLLKPILDPSGRIDDDGFHHSLRKAAHFSEYAALGFCVSGLLFSVARARGIRRLISVSGACAVAAFIDEGIQLFAPGRGAQLSDVLLDTCGAAFGMAVFLLLGRLIRTHRKAP